jgi:hypothetical protein
LNLKIYKNILLLFVIIASLFCSEYVLAESNNVQAVGSQKIWRINFNDEVRFDNLTKQSIYVKDKNDFKVDISLELSEDGKSVLVKPPQNGYVMGSEYTLNIDNNIYSTENKKLKKSSVVNFFIENIEESSSVIKAKNNKIIEAVPGKVYLINEINNLFDSKTLKELGWKTSTYKYEVMDNEGTMLENSFKSKPLQIPLKFKGDFSIYLGYVRGTEEIDVKIKEKVNKVKIEDNYDEDNDFEYIREVFIDNVYLNNNIITIMPSLNKKTRIAYIKLIALNDEQFELHHSNNYKLGKVIYDNDGYSNFFGGMYFSEDALEKRAVDELVELNAREINWCIGTTGMLNYDSEYAGKAFAGSYKYNPLIREGDKLARRQIWNILRTGKSPLQIVAERGDEKEIEVNASMRMNAFYSSDHQKIFNGKIYDEYKDCIQDGSVYLSYYYPKFRRYIKNILKEASSFQGVDGVTLDFCRYPNVIGNEANLKEKTIVMNNFMREVRNMIPKDKNITVRIPYKDYLSYGLDVETWIEQGLIDRLIPSCISYENFFDITPFVKMVKNTKVELYAGITANLEGHDITKEEEKLIKKGIKLSHNKYLNVNQYLKRAHEVYEEGADGVFLFNTLVDPNFNDPIPSEMKLLTDKILLKKWHEFKYDAGLVINEIIVK